MIYKHVDCILWWSNFRLNDINNANIIVEKEKLWKKNWNEKEKQRKIWRTQRKKQQQQIWKMIYIWLILLSSLDVCLIPVYIKKIANCSKINQITLIFYFINKTCSRAARKEITIFTIEFLVTSKRTVNKTISKS